MPRILTLLLWITCSLALVGCSISRNVRPVENASRIDKIYIEENPRVHMEGLLPEMVTQLEAMGYVTETYLEAPPSRARYTMTFTANWAWDVTMYLTYFRAELWDRGQRIGEAEYDARAGSANLGKFGTTADKIRPLLEEMLGHTPAS
ncbi:MAG: Sbal_3080 family lipoprotein [Planctomycetota bacterium]